MSPCAQPKWTASFTWLTAHQEKIMGNELLPCPFCSSVATLTYDAGNEVIGQRWWAHCETCGARTKTTLGTSTWETGSAAKTKQDTEAKAEAIAAWNRRALRSSVGDVEAVARIIDPEAFKWRPLPRDPDEGPAQKAAYDEMDRNDQRAMDRRKVAARSKARAILSLLLSDKAALEAERDVAKQEAREAISLVSEYAREAGEAKGRLEMSEAAGIVDGWRERALSAEARATASEAERDGLRAAMEEIANGDYRIISGSPGPLFSAGWAGCGSHIAKVARTALSQHEDGGEGGR